MLAPGYKADFNVVDFDTLSVSEPKVAYDLPAGGRRLIQRASVGCLGIFIAMVTAVVWTSCGVDFSDDDAPIAADSGSDSGAAVASQLIRTLLAAELRK